MFISQHIYIWRRLCNRYVDEKEICEELIKKENFQLCKLDECLGAELAETKNKEKIKDYLALNEALKDVIYKQKEDFSEDEINLSKSV